MDLLTALVGGAIGGLTAAIAAGWYTLKAQRERYEHERALARESRLQARRERVYERIMRNTYRLVLFVERTEPSIQFGEAIPPPGPLPDDELVELNALTAAHASPEVRARAKAVSSATGRFQARVWRLQAERKGASAMAIPEALKGVEDARKAFHEQLHDLEEQIAAELVESSGLK